VSFASLEGFVESKEELSRIIDYDGIDNSLLSLKINCGILDQDLAS